MDISGFLSYIRRHPSYSELINWMSSDSKNLTIKGLCGSAASFLLHSAQKESDRTILYILHDAEEAGYFYSDLVQISGDNDVLYFPSSYKKKVKDGTAKDAPNQVLRTEALNRISGGKGIAVVTYPDALAEKVVDQAILDKETIRIHAGDKVSIDSIADRLCEFGFEQVDFVYEPGQFSIRGSLIDVFSYSNDIPFRIDFFGDDIDSIRSFDIESQISVESLDEISIVSGVVNDSEAEMVSLLSFLDKSAIICHFDATFAIDTIAAIKEANADSNAIDEAVIFEANARQFKTIEIGLRKRYQSRKTIEFTESPQPIFHKNFDLTGEEFAKRIEAGYTVFVSSDNPKQTDRLRDIFEERGDKVTFTPVNALINEGFIDHDLKICLFTDHQIFDRFHKYTLKSNKTRAGKAVLSLKELMQFQIGDYVIHSDHGVGQFGGLIRMDLNGKMQEVIKLTFSGSDIIFVNIHSLHKISKYKSRDGEPPKLNKLGSPAWNNLKEKTKRQVKDIARELIKLYAQRRTVKGFSYSVDGYMQQELESSFLYEDTPDQSKATVAVKRDMESDKPMDRLICGDVGFGKTEIAIRAAFKAATDGKQVAVLVPTTVLAFQHFKSFSRRLKRFPVNIDYISRARSSAEVREIKEKLASGKIDILVGTHKILGKDLKFKDLGLLIIDEEQKFGVSAKEKLRQMRTNIDTLTLTATPIPRTLQFSLMGARDLSIIATPPPNRYPVQTQLIGWDDDTIKEAIEYELARGGQVFFVNNRISNLEEIATRIRNLVPKVRVCIGHGQMDSEKLEGILLNFINGEYDVLLATSIIESGIDIPNVNTMFINSAQHFGLSDLHQLRGRVGRANKKAFCYLITPPLNALPTESRRRVQAIENFSDLGSGIHIAMQDLDIRGAGNILGGEQSGFISDLGFETYHRILDEAVHELKHDEFQEMFEEEIKNENENYITECVFESDLELLFPSEYVQNVSERMELYRRLDTLSNQTDLDKFVKEMEDRFGALPEVSRELIDVVRLRWLCMRLAVEKATLRKEKLTLYFISNFNSAFYKSDIFNNALMYSVNHVKDTQFREQDGKRFMRIDGIGSVDAAIRCLTDICGDEAKQS